MIPPPPRITRSPRDNAGAALIIVLAFVVLLSGLIISFFTRAITERQVSDSSSNQTKVDLLARSAINVIIADLKQEIVDGSNQSNDPRNPGEKLPLYYPKSPVNMVPQRSGNPPFATPGDPLSDPIPNLIRRSWSDDSSLTVRSRASALSTTTPSLNFRAISASRWNSHYLIPRANPGSTAIESQPIAEFIPPDWVMVTSANGPEVLTTPTSDVIGRYAFAIYDEGGLLDVNAAGYPSSLTLKQIGEKGSLALADLTALGLSATEVNKLIGWRNYATVQPTGTMASDFNFDSDAATRYVDYLRNSSNGFLSVNPASFSGRTDQIFPGRQALLRFRKAVGFSQDALQYLGTFTRDLEQPSYVPDPSRPKNTTHQWAGGDVGYGGNDAYDATGARQDRINPELLAVRDSNNQPVLKRRFPLSRLALVKPNPSPEDALKIKDYFGLTWETLSGSWIYDHGDPNRIYNLEEIVGREPDFFETLKAAIHCGSLGKQYGGTESNVPVSPHHFDDPNGAAIDGVVHFQLIRIGANMIDQYDIDSYPTAITFGSPARPFYGVENLPYFLGWMQSWYHMKQLTASDIHPARQPPGAGANGYPKETWVMFQPILWNPHAPDANLDIAQVPTNFRVAAGSMTGTGITVYPQTRPAWWTGGYIRNYPRIEDAPSMASPNSWAAATFDPTVSLLTFQATPNSTANVPASFQEPYRLLYHNPPGSNADAAYAQGKFNLNALGPVADSVLAAADGNTIIGFFAGKCWAGPSAANTPISGESPRNCLSGGSMTTADIQFTLQYEDSTGTWRNYDVINQVYTTNQPANVATIDNQDTGTNIRAFPMGIRADPRTDRWGLFTLKSFPLATNPTGVVPALGNGIHTAPVYNFPQGTTLSPNAGMNIGCVYRLARNASGQALVGWTTVPYLSDLSVNLSTGNTSSYIPGRKFYYNDPDNVLRRASGAFFSSTTSANTNDGLPFATGNYTSRPVILNRPFRSVAEMGYTFSDTPWKDINFLAPESGDSALLDAFCINELDSNLDAIPDEDVTVAGRINLNTRQPKVLESLIRGALKWEESSTNTTYPLTNTEAEKAAKALVVWTGDTTSSTAGTPAILTKGPLRNRSELVGKFVKAVTYASPPSSNLPNIGYDGAASYSGFSSVLVAGTTGVFPNSPDGKKDAAIKRRRECVMRALVDSGNVRTWNLLIDVIVQTGRYPANASSSADLPKFVVQGENRYWVHLAIDRITGEVVAQQLEKVFE